MNKTNGQEIITEERITVNSDSLAKLLDCGRVTAVEIGEASGAKVQVGRRVLWNLKKVQAYIDSCSTVGGDE